MLVGFGLVLGVVLGAFLAVIWGLRRARDDRAALALVCISLGPLGYSTAAEALGWPTLGSWARAAVVDDRGDAVALAAVTAVVAAITMAALTRAGATRRLQRWATEAP